MIVPERYNDFIDSMDPGFEGDLERLYESALEENVPVIRRQSAMLLKFLIAQKHPDSILEIGTAIGFSALFMADCMPAGGHITTIEKVTSRIEQAKKNIKAFGQEDRITLLEGDAADILCGLKDSGYDMIFMDGAKGQYINFLPQVKRLLAPGGILVSDNVLSDGQIIQSRFAVERRDRTIHKRMRDYLFELTHDEDFTTTILPLGDGVSISVKGIK